MSDPIAIARCFLGPRAALRVQPLGAGLINQTWLVDGVQPRAVLQRINSGVFPDAAGIMANLARLQDHLAARPRADLRLPAVRRAVADAAPLVVDEQGGQWRLLEYIAPSQVLAPPCSPAQAREVGAMLGRFHAACADLDPTTLTPTLPNLHATPAWLAGLRQALNHHQHQHQHLNHPLDPAVADLVAAIEARAALVPVLEQARAAGQLPLRVVHGDPKLDNVLFDPDGQQAIALIDLDTVQPGLIHHDLADCLRSCCNRRGEAACDHGTSPAAGMPTVHFDLALAAALLAGYANAAPALLSATEIGLLDPAIRLLPLELAIRFLTDHLQGDRWFRVAYRGQNLDKARVQLALLADIEAKAGPLQQLITATFTGPG